MGSKVIRTRWVVKNKGTAGETKCLKGLLSHDAAAGRNKDHIVAVVDFRRESFSANFLPNTFVELPNYNNIDTQTRCCGRLQRCLYGARQAARLWQREIGIKAAGKVMGKMSTCSFKSPWREVGWSRARRRQLACRTEITC